jgi:hypothetical protein
VLHVCRKVTTSPARVDTNHDLWLAEANFAWLAPRSDGPTPYFIYHIGMFRFFEGDPLGIPF